MLSLKKKDPSSLSSEPVIFNLFCEYNNIEDIRIKNRLEGEKLLDLSSMPYTICLMFGYGRLFFYVFIILLLARLRLQ
jgi:hypothetical protein